MVLVGAYDSSLQLDSQPKLSLTEVQTAGTTGDTSFLHKKKM